MMSRYLILYNMDRLEILDTKIQCHGICFISNIGEKKFLSLSEVDYRLKSKVLHCGKTILALKLSFFFFPVQ